MDISRILADLRAERDRINQAIAAIESLGKTGNHITRRGRPATTASQPAPKPARGRRRGMSAAARKRLSEMMKKRWAERKKKAKAK